MTTGEAMSLYHLLETFKDIKGPPNVAGKFAYGVARNKEKIRIAVKNLHSKYPIDPKEQKKYEDRRMALLKEYADKDSDGNPEIVDGEFKGLEGNKEFQKKHEELDEEFKDFIEVREKVYSEELDIDFYKVLDDYLPPSLSGDGMEAILFMVREQ